MDPVASPNSSPAPRAAPQADNSEHALLGPRTSSGNPAVIIATPANWLQAEIHAIAARAIFLAARAPRPGQLADTAKSFRPKG
jgi:hypothetical protein